MSRDPRPSRVTGRSVCVGIGEERLLRQPALVPQPVQVPRVDAMAGGLEPLLQHARQRQVHVVAAEQDVFADRDPLEREIATRVRRPRSG